LGPFPHVGEIVEELADRPKSSPGAKEEFADAKRETIIRGEKNITLFLNHHAYAVEKDGLRMTAVLALNTMTSEVKRFAGACFADCTGHATIGALAGADATLKEEGHMGMSNMWRWKDTGAPAPFPDVPWALPLEMNDFPYPNKGAGEWFWETGFSKHPINDLEYMRDWNLRAVYGAFNAMKNKGGKEKHVNARLEWVAYVGGTRESRQLLGDLLLTKEDIVGKKPFSDACVPTTWDIDLHYPKEQYTKKFADDPFISKAVFGNAVDRKHGYPVPYRCFYSRNIENLFMAGRCVSVTHEALGTIRVMKTGGMMGEVVGKATALCVKHKCTPRDVYASHWDELTELLRLPGSARRDTVNGAFDLRPDAPGTMPAPGAPSGNAQPGASVDPAKLPGQVIDDTQAKLVGDWKSGERLQGYIGAHYLYHGREGKASARFEFNVPKTGRYEVRVSHQPHENRATNTPVSVISAEGTKTVRVNQRAPAPLPNGFVSLGVYRFEAGQAGAVVIANDQVDGIVHADAVQVLPAE
ncbi:MAG: FAD-dependent oxidoreductase, partial [Planctomycetota bacterium]|nr:FAD-dependent oxidoreductase [Planctomycetota bacterium]